MCLRSLGFSGKATTCAALILSFSFIVADVCTGQQGQGQPAPLLPDEEPVARPKNPVIAEASNEGELAMAAIKLPEGVTATLFAAEPNVANPVAIDVDRNGNVYVCETFRQEKGVEDNRNHPEWLLDDLLSRSVADRLAYMKKHLGDKIITYSEQDDRIRLLKDTDGDGKADSSEVFADGFNRPEDGTGAGVLALDDRVLYTCIPHLWSLKKLDDGTLQREKIHSGFGVRFAFRGHDLHGLTIGPDGRLYFSIGDRGYNLGNRIGNLESGAVFRCELDGSDLEVFATGLRNPQELAFDDHGNLFTGDNNSDSGIDQARLVYVVEGGDSGWRMQYQYMDDRGPFVRESIWDPANKSVPEYVVPPVAILGDGPSGLTHYPGTGWSDEYKDQFFMCDFRGQANLSGIRTFKFQPQRLGASFDVVEEKQSIWGVLATDVDFGTDGRLYISDWVESWDGVGKGRIYTLSHANAKDNALVDEVNQLLKQGMTGRNVVELGRLLSHADQRVRMEAQFELVRQEMFDEFIRHVSDRNEGITQLHCLWGLSQLLRKGFKPTDGQNTDLRRALEHVLASNKAEVRANACKMIGDNRIISMTKWLVDALTDPSSYHVRFHGAIALGKTGTREHVPAIITFLANNADKDPFLRHAGIMALAGIARPYHLAGPDKNDSKSFFDKHPLHACFSHRSPSVRLASVVALRRLNSALASGGLTDRDPNVVLASARAIYDAPTRKTFVALAKSLQTTKHTSATLLRMMLHANYTLGQSENGSALAIFAVDPQNDLSLRVEAFQLMENWEQPDAFDKINGRARYLGTRRSIALRLVLNSMWPKIEDEPDELVLAFVKTVRTLKAATLGPTLVQIANDPKFGVSVREMALTTLGEFNAKGAGELIDRILDSDINELKIVAVRVLSQSDPEKALVYLQHAIKSELKSERQGAYQTLSTMKDDKSFELIRESALSLEAIPADTRLDVFTAAQLRYKELQPDDAEKIESSVSQFPNGKYELALVGGNAERGAAVYRRAELSCVRCHKVESVGGNIGPDLSHLGSQKDRAYLLRSITKPNAEIAENFGSVLILDTDGRSHIGIIKSKDEERIQLMDDQGVVTEIKIENVEDMRETKSAMPEDLIDKISPNDLRDLIEYLSALR